MDSNTGSGSGPVKKQEDLDANEPKVAPKAESKPAVRTLNRVPRKLWPSLYPTFTTHAFSVGACVSATFASF